MKTILKKTMFGIALMLAGIAGAAVPGTQVTFSSTGPDAYPDGTAVVDGEYYALAWAEDDAKLVMSTDGTVAEGRVLARVAVAEGHRCPPVNVKLDDETANACQDGVWGVFLLDTRGHGEGDSSIESATRIANATVEIASNGFLSYKKFGPRLGVPGITEGVTDNPVAAIGDTGYASLADAITAASNGDTITVLPGTFDVGSDTVVVNKEVTITGAGKDTTTLNFTATTKAALSIQASNVTIKDMTINQSDKNSDNTCHVSVAAAGSDACYSNVTLSNLKLGGGRYSMFIYGEAFTIDGCDFSGQGSSQIVVDATKGNSKITNNTFADNGKKYNILQRHSHSPTTVTSYGKLTISGNTSTGCGLLYILEDAGTIDTTQKMELEIVGNEVKNYTNKAVAFCPTDELGKYCSAVTITNNAFYTTAANRPVIQRDDSNRTSLTIDATANYWGASTPDFDNPIQDGGSKYLIMPHDSSNIAVDTYYQAYDEDTDTLSNLYEGLYVAQIGTTKYASLADAIAAVPTDGTATTITMIADETLEGNAGVTIAANQNVVLDLNGHKVELVVANASAQAYLIQNNGTLTVNDSGTGGRLYANGEGKGGNNAKCAIQNAGQLTVNGGTISAKSTNGSGVASGAANAVHCPAPDANVSITINGGTLTADGGASMMNIVTSSAVYIRWNSDSRTLAFTMTGGTLTGGGSELCSAVDVYLGNKTAMSASINISGGELNGSYAALRVRGGTSDYEGVNTTISGGTFTGLYEPEQTHEWALDVRAGSLAVTGGTFNYGSYLGTHEIDISGGSFTEDVILYRASGTADASISGGTFGGDIVIGGTTENVTVDEDTNLYAGGKFISGGNFSEPVPEELCADTYVPTPRDPVTGMYTVRQGSYVAQIVTDGGATTNMYGSLADAIAAVPADGTETTITMIADEEILTNAGVVIPAGKNVILDLNGKTVSQVAPEAKASTLITNRGTLKVMDSTATTVGGVYTSGKITAVAEHPDSAYGYGNNTIENFGVLEIASGIVEQTSTGAGAYYALNAREGGTVTISGGLLRATYGVAVRQVSFGAAENALTITGGEIIARAYALQLAGMNNNQHSHLSISGGTLTTTSPDYEFAVYVGNQGGNFANIYMDITGGTFNGSVVTTAAVVEENMSVSGGRFNGEYGCVSYGNQKFVTGGEFSGASALSTEWYLEDGLCLVMTPDGYYTVKDAVAQIVLNGEILRKYDSLAVAIANAQDGHTVQLLVDIEDVSGTFTINKSITLDGAGHSITAAPVPADGHRNMFSLWGGGTAMFKVETGAVTFKNVTLDGDVTHRFTFLISADNSSIALTTENVRLIHGGEISVDSNSATITPGNGYGAAIHLNNGAQLVVSNGFYACTGTNVNGVTTGIFPFTAILPENLEAGTSVAFELTGDPNDPANVDIGDDLLLVGMEGDLIDTYGLDGVQGMLDFMKVPSRFIPYTLTLGDGSTYSFTGASPRTWNEIIDYGKDIMDVATSNGFDGLDKDTTPVEVGLAIDTVIPDVFTFADTNLTVNGNGKALSGEIKYTDNAGLIENIVLGTEDNALVLDLTEVTQPIEIGSGIAVTNVTMKMTADQATAGTPVIIWDVEGGVEAPENEAGVTVAIVDDQGEPTGDTAELIWDDELGLAYIGPCEARLTGPTHDEPIYTTLANAIAWAEQSGDTVTLMMDITNVTGTVLIDKSLILDGAGHAITAATNSEPRDVVSAYSGARVMLQIGGDNVVVTNITLNGGTSHYFTYLIEAKHGTLTVADVELLHGGEADESGEKGVGYGAGIHVNGATLLVEGNFVADTGGETDGVFPFTGILYDSGDVAFANGVTADIGDDLLLVGMGPLNVQDFMDSYDIDAILDGMNVPNGFIPYTLALNGADSGMGFVGASPRKWNDIIDYGKEIMDVADTIGYDGMDKNTTPVEVGLLTDTILPDTFTFADTNFTVNGNGNALSGTIKYTDNAGLIHDIVLGTEGNGLVLDMTETTKPVVLGSGIAVSNVTVQMTAEQATAGTPVIIWDAEGGVDAPENEAGVIVQIVDDQGDPTGDTKGLIWDDELGVAYIGPCEARLTGPTHDKPIYTTLADAIARAEQTGDTVTLMMNVTNVTATYEIAKQDLVIDGGSNMVSAAAVTEHRNLFEAWGGSKNMFKLQSGNITFRNITLDGDATHAYTFLISADNSSIALTTENVRLLHGGEQSVDANDTTLTPGNGYGAAIHLNNGAVLTVKDGFYACTGTNENGVTTGVFPFTAILPENLDAGTLVTFDLTEDTDANPTVDIGDDLLLVGMEGDLIDEYGINVVQGMLDYMKVPSRFIPYTLTLGDGSAYAFTGASPRRWNEIINYGKDIMEVSTAMGFDGLDKNTTPVEVGLATDTVLPAGVAGDGYDFLYEDSNFSVNGNGNALSGTIKFTDGAEGGMLRDIELGRDGAPLTLDLSATTNAVMLGGEVVISNVVIKLTEDQATVGKIVFEWDATDETPDDEQGVEVTVVNGSGEPTGETKGLIWDEEYGIAYIGPCEARLTGPTHDTPVYTTLSNAIERAASSGDTVTLMTNVTLAACQTIDKSIEFSLNGKFLAANGDAILVDSGAAVQMYSEGTVTGNVYVASGTLTITNGIYVGTLGKASGDSARIAVSGGYFLEPVLQDYCADGYSPVKTTAPEYAATPYTVARIEIVYPTGQTAGGLDTVGVPIPVAWINANTDLIGTDGLVLEELDPIVTGLGQTGTNGLPLWQSYVLGLDPNDVTSQLRLEGLPATADGMVTIRGLNINVPAILESQGTTVGFHLEEAAPGSDSWTVRDDACTMAEGLPTFTVQLSTVDGKVLRIVADIATVAK